MIYLLLFFGVFFILKGILLINGRTVPKGVRARIQDERTLRGWCYGTGVVHVLWGLRLRSGWPTPLYHMPCMHLRCLLQAVLPALS